MKLTFIILLLFFAKVAIGQHSGKILGDVADPAGKPLPATIVLYLYPDSSIRKVLETDSLGRFAFHELNKGIYFIKASRLGYLDYTSAIINITDDHLPIVKSCVLIAAPNILKEITVRATLPKIEQRADRMIFNVSGSAFKEGATAFEMLQKVPGITLVNDHIKVSGKGGVQIMIDGKPSPYVDMESVLKDMPAFNIDKIELITNPGAAWDASGSSGIINLVLKKSFQPGFSASVVTGAGYSYYRQIQPNLDAKNFQRYNNAVTLQYRMLAWEFFANIDQQQRHVFEVNDEDRTISGKNYKLQNFYPYHYDTFNNKIGASFHVDKANKISINVSRNSRSGEGTSETKTSIYDIDPDRFSSAFNTSNLTVIQRRTISGNLSYDYLPDSTGKQLTTDLDYSRIKYHTSQQIRTLPYSTNVNQFVNTPLYYITLKSSYTHPLTDKLKFSAGFKVSQVNINHELQFLRNGALDPENTNHLHYRENIQSLYISLDHKLKQFEYALGLRSERTATKSTLLTTPSKFNSYINLFPSFSMSYGSVTAYRLSMAYSRRIDRPHFTLLSPFRYYTDTLTYSQGNPNLLPQFTHSARFALGIRNKYFVAITFNSTSNTIYENAPAQSGMITYTSPQNLGRFTNFVMEINVPWAFGNLISGNTNIQGIFNNYQTPYLGERYSARRLTMLLSTSMLLKISHRTKAEIYGFYNGKSLSELMTVRPYSGVSLSLQQEVFNNHGHINLSMNDIFYKNKTLSEINFANINTRRFYRDESRNIRLTFSYQIGKNGKQSERRPNGHEENSRL